MFFLRPFRLFAKALVVDATPHQMALGCAFGVWVGLVPKGNLLAVGLMMVLCSLRVNLAVGLMAVFVMSWTGMLLDSITHQVGSVLLKSEMLKPLWTVMYDTIVFPWTDFNNTVVLGSFMLGIALFVPTYLVSRPIFAVVTPRLSERVKKFKLVALLWGGELTGKVC